MALPKHIQDTFSKILADLGLNKSEAAVFTYLIQSGTPQRVTEIAKRGKMNRTTLYGILKTLSERGLVSSATERGTLRYRAIQPHLLIDYIERARNELSAHTDRIKNVIPLIEKMRATGGRASPSIQFFEGTEGIKQAYEDTIKGNPSKTVYGFTGTDAIYKFMQLDWIQYFLERRTKAGIKWNTIAMDSDQSRKMKARDGQESRFTKLLPKGYDFDIELAAYENKVLISAFAEDHPSAVLIEDEKIAETFKTLFRYIDSTLKE